MLRTLKDIRSSVHRQDDRRLSGKTVGTVDMARASCLCLQNEGKKGGKGGKPLGVVLPHGTDTDIHCSSGKSYSSLKEGSRF